MSTAQRPLSRWTSLAYGAGSIGTANFIVGPQLLLMFYMTEQLRIPAIYAGAVLLTVKTLEFFTAPAIGLWLDRRAMTSGRRRSYLSLSAVVFGLAYAGLYAAPNFEAWPSRLAFVLCVFVMATLVYSAFAVPYVALSGELAAERADRTRLVAYRMAFAAVGILIAGGVAPWVVDVGGGDQSAYALMGLSMAMLSAGTMLVSAIAVPLRPHGAPETTSTTLRTRTSFLGAVGTFHALQACYIIQMIASGANGAMLAYYVKYVLRSNEGTIAVFFVIFTLLSILAVPLSVMLAARVGKWRAFLWSSILYGLGYAALLPAAQWGIGGFLTTAALLGVAAGINQVLAYALLPDAIDEDARARGTSSEGALTGTWIALEKVGLAAGAAGVGALIDFAGYVEGQAKQPPEALLAIAILFSIVPAVLVGISLIAARGGHIREILKAEGIRR